MPGRSGRSGNSHAQYLHEYGDSMSDRVTDPRKLCKIGQQMIVRRVEHDRAATNSGALCNPSRRKLANDANDLQSCHIRRASTADCSPSLNCGAERQPVGTNVLRSGQSLAAGCAEPLSTGVGLE